MRMSDRHATWLATVCLTVAWVVMPRLTTADENAPETGGTATAARVLTPNKGNATAAGERSVCGADAATAERTAAQATQQAWDPATMRAIVQQVVKEVLKEVRWPFDRSRRTSLANQRFREVQTMPVELGGLTRRMR